MNTILKVLPFFLLISPWILHSQGIQQVRADARTDLQNATQRLSVLREDIEKQKIPLAQKVARQEREATEKRKELDRRLRLRDNRDANLLQLKEEVQKNERELKSSLRLLKDYARSWRQGTPPAEQALWSEKLGQSLLKDQGPIDQSIQAYLDILQLSIHATKEQAGGLSFTGDAIVPPEGMREEGIFWAMGPVSFFSGSDGSAGFIENSFHSDKFSSIDLSSESVKRIEPSRLLQASEGSSISIAQALSTTPRTLSTIPLDPSLGKAFVMEGGELSVVEELQKGGIWIFPILFFAAISLLIAVFKAFQILGVPTPKKLASLDGSYRGPFELLRKTAKSYQGNKPEILEEILYEGIIDFQVRLEKALPLIAVTAATAPLLGLLGTVTGMIDVFRQITNFANPENSELARGISEALVTTKFGLITAIPSLIAHALLSRRLQGVVSKLEGFAARLVHLKREESNHAENESSINEPTG